jgi:2-dehydropantoate 2-reductase
MTNIMIVGAGAVGGFFGAHLAQHHPGVSFLLRPRTLQAVRDRGLTVRSAKGAFTVRPPATGDPRDLPSPDLIILSMKAYDLDEVMDQIEPVISDQTVLLTLQNGVDLEDRILARLKRDCVVGGVAFIYSKIVEPGVIEHYKRGAVAIGELSGQKSPRVLEIAELFAQAGLPCQISDDIRRSKWEKMCWNCVFNPLTVIIDDRISKALDHPEMLRTIHEIVGEVAAVAAGLNVPLGADMAAKVLRWSQEIRDIHTSMYDDWKADRPTEIDSLNGYVVKRGQELGILTPVNEALVAMIKVITERERQGPEFLRMDGAVMQPITLDRAALVKLPAEHQVPDVSALLPGMQGQGIRVEGLLEIPTLAIGADHVTFHSHDGRFAASLTLQQAIDYGIVVYQVKDGPLPPQHGGSYRLITPGLGDLCANVKGVGRIELTCGPGYDTRPSTKKQAAS